MRYRSKKFYKWDSNIAYLTGLIAADGCIVNNGRHLNVTSKDIELINHTQLILDMNVKFNLKRSILGGEAYNLQFSNVAFYDFLLDVGLTPAKSKTIPELKVPDEYYPDFLRGYFDGDGTIYGFWDTRWKSSLMYYTGFTSASPAFLKWLSITNARLFRTSPGFMKKSPSADTLMYAKADSYKLFEAMYYKPNLLYLGRKYTKFIDFFKSDPYANKALLARVL